MKKILITMLVMIVSVAVLCAGCASPSGTPQVIQLEQPKTEQETQDSTLTLSATQTVKVMPDVAYITIGVTTKGDSAESAQKENAKITQNFLNAVKAQGISDKDMQTANINVYQDYDNEKMYVMENSYKITIKNIDNVGAVIDAALGAGANSTYSLSFDVLDRDSVYMNALALAMESVGVKAKTVAAAGGYEIVRPLSITESSSGYSEMLYMQNEAAAADGASAPTPVSPQEIEISATVTGEYIIK
ncbi:MAG: SIMPL domain-containing protein [Christensenellaceae bacterium]